MIEKLKRIDSSPASYIFRVNNLFFILTPSFVHSSLQEVLEDHFLSKGFIIIEFENLFIKLSNSALSSDEL